MVVASIDLLFESALLLGAICFSVAVYVLAKDVSNKLNLSFSALAFTISLWALSFFIAGVLGLRTFESLHLITTLLLAPLSMLFMQVLFRPEGPFFLWWTRLTFLISVVLVPLVTFGLDTYAWVRDMSYFSPVLIVFALLYMYLGEALGMVNPRGGPLSHISRKDLLNAIRARNTWIYLGGVLVTLTSTMDRVPWMGSTAPAIANLFLAIYVYGLKDVVLQRAYVSTRRIFGRVLADAATALVLATVFVIMTVWVRNSILLFTLNAFLVAVLGLFSAGPLRSLFTLFYERFFFKEASRIDDLVKRAGRELSGAFDAPAIGQVVDNFLEQAIGARIQSFYALDAEGRKFEKVLDATLDTRLPRALSVAYPLILHWQKATEWKPILVSEMEAESERATMTADTVAIQLTLESLSKLESSLALPLMVERTVAGFVTLRVDSPPDPWRSSWGILTLLKPFFLRAGEALHDLDVYTSLRERERLAVLGEMSAGLAHEIRNPLGAIKGAAQVLELESGDRREPFVDIIVEEVDRLNEVVTQFLNYAKPFQGESKFVDLNALAADVIRRFERRLASSGAALPVRIELETNAPVAAYCQEELIGQVLTNLLDNAYSALTRVGNEVAAAATLRVRVGVDQTAATNLFTIEVEDNGPGIPREHLDKVFIPFFSRSKNGTGLGLPICQRIAEAHGGRIELESQERRGTRASLRFPSRRPPPVVEA